LAQKLILAAQVGFLNTKPAKAVLAEAIVVAQPVAVQQLAVPVGVVVVRCLGPFPRYHDWSHQEPLQHDFF